MSVVSAKAGTIGRMIEIFEEDPSRFIFNLLFVAVLLVLGGVFAGKAEYLVIFVLTGILRSHHRINDS